MIDLHTHSRCSDGSLSPTDLIHLASEKGLRVLALTDHDSVSGIEEAQRAVFHLNKAKKEGEEPFIFVPGVELDIEWKPGDLHLLGLGLQTIHPELTLLLEQLVKGRNERNAEIAHRFNAVGIELDMCELEKLAGGGTVGRPHFAQYLTEKKVVKNRQQAFDKYLGNGKPFYIPRKNISLDAGIAAIKASGGIPILAHPMSLYLSWGTMPDIIKDFVERGLAGLEAWHPGTRLGNCKRLEALAKELNICTTAGSDFHGAARPERKLGRTVSGLKIHDRFYFEELAPLLNH